MTRTDPRRVHGKGLSLRAALLAARAIPLIAPFLLRRRLARGKELADRWQEKLGSPSQPRPDGSLIWLHAVGLGEVMALRGLIATMAEQEPNTSFLVTSTTRASAELLAANLPPRTRHQFLPLDAPAYLRRFLDHWRPDLSIWAEQDLWPGAIVAAADRGIPLALVNARMNAGAFARRERWKGLYRDLLSRFDIVSAQDETTARHLQALGAAKIEIGGSLKSAAPRLSADPARLSELQRALAGRRVWVAASTHAEDEAIALAAQAVLVREDPGWLLILAPRFPGRRNEILASVPPGLTVTVGSRGEDPVAAVHLADALGELGLWYRLAPLVLMGGTFGSVDGHNPWEPAALGAAVLHGPRVANFAHDFALMDGAGAAMEVDAGTLVDRVANSDATAMGAQGQALVEGARGGLAPLAAKLLALRVLA